MVNTNKNLYSRQKILKQEKNKLTVKLNNLKEMSKSESVVIKNVEAEAMEFD